LDLLNPIWERRLLLEDPRTSTPGLAFLLYTEKVLGGGGEVWKFWKKLSRQWLAMTVGWEGAYGLFLKKEAPLVWSYLTSQAYHEENGDLAGDKRRFQTLLFEEGQPYQLEGAAIVKGSLKSPEDRILARRFLEYLISTEVQKKIPKKLWMYPVLEGVEIPKSFQNLPKSIKLIPLAVPRAPRNETQRLLNQWRQSVSP
jgi:thiamine transport system substrate-binding protein